MLRSVLTGAIADELLSRFITATLNQANATAPKPQPQPEPDLKTGDAVTEGASPTLSPRRFRGRTGEFLGKEDEDRGGGGEARGLLTSELISTKYVPFPGLKMRGGVDGEEYP